MRDALPAEVPAWAPSVEVNPPEEELPYIAMEPGEMTLFPSSEALPGEKTPPPGTPLPVLLLIAQAQAATGEERQALAYRINRLLEQMVLEGGSRHLADWFHHLIESDRLEGLVDGGGFACHETAIQGLLTMGFPYALEVRPEDLARVRLKAGRRARGSSIKPLAATVAAGGCLLQLVLDLARHGAMPSAGLTLEVGAVCAALVAVLRGKPGSPMRQMGLAVMVVAGLLSVFLGSLPGYAGLVSGLAALGAAALFANHES
ncbi:hypothetical protein [Hyalangium rubrum]|uniref:Uncharacterized protein n=1 Tax=Hyalangium rubrum TaxID=3103134 RepID=A0ABU5HE95_9BACT|nr:hypothetical protein [Hyalangium sp. s54d21]MDY7231788.1 hypothetical protein [Hyalangium sp. s54d21]